MSCKCGGNCNCRGGKCRKNEPGHVCKCKKKSIKSTPSVKANRK